MNSPKGIIKRMMEDFVEIIKMFIVKRQVSGNR